MFNVTGDHNVMVLDLVEGCPATPDAAAFLDWIIFSFFLAETLCHKAPTFRSPTLVLMRLSYNE